MSASESSSKSINVRLTLNVFWKHLKKHFFPFIFLCIFIIGAEAIPGLLAPWYGKLFLDAIIAAQGHVDQNTIQSLFVLLALFVIARTAGSLLWRFSGFIASHIQPHVVSDLEETAFTHVLKHSYQFFSNTFAGSLVRKIKGFSSAFREIAESFWWQLLPLLVTFIGTAVILWFRRPILSLIIVCWFLLFLGINLVVVRYKVRYDIRRAAKDSESTATLADALSNSINIKLFDGVAMESARYARVNEERRSLQTKSWRIGELNATFQNVLNFFAEAVVLYAALQLWARSFITIGDIVLVQTYVLAMFRRTHDMNQVLRRLYEAFAEAKEMVDILEMPYDVQDKSRAKALTISRGKIEFKDAIFNYSKTRRVLDHFTLAIASREKVALVGPSGAGKSTIVKLLFRFYDVDRGKILIDGQSIADVTQDSLRHAIALVPQDPILFHRTLKENIRYGRREASDEEVIEAAKKAHAHEFIQQAPQGYETYVGERGIKLSGGERQRVAIARAILKNAPILVLDEATSSLDSESESLIQDALRELMKNKTVIVIAHRLSTIMQMDRIIVVQDGKVVDTGTHDELLQKVGVYQKLWNIQAGGFVGIGSAR